MDHKTLVAVTKALDTSIASVAEEEFDNLCEGLSRQQIANGIRDSLRSLEKLRSGLMPNYDNWDAVFYSLWYQTSHINLAYTLARQIPGSSNPLLSGNGSLQVFDFGCGALAMQCGLVLAATETMQEQETLPQIAIISEDASGPMKEIGQKIWRRFLDQIAKYHELKALRDVCRTMGFDVEINSPATFWLTALHLAYKEYQYKVKIHQGLGELVQKYDPSVVLITTHPQNRGSAYSPDVSAYEKNEKTLTNLNYLLYRTFPDTTRFRRSLHLKFSDLFNSMSPKDKDLVEICLKRHNTAWVPDTEFKSYCALYTRR